MRRDLVALCFATLLLTSLSPLPATADFIESALTVTTWKWLDMARTSKTPAMQMGVIMRGIGKTAKGETAFAAISVVCSGGGGMLRIEWGEEEAVSRQGLDVRYRFGGQPERRLNAIYTEHNMVYSKTPADIRQFLSDATVADSLFVSLNSTKLGMISTTFDAKGGKDMADKYAAACPKIGGKKH